MNFPKLPRHWRTYVTLQNGAVALGMLIALSWSWGTVSTLQKNFALQQQVDTLDQEVELSTLQNQNLTFQQNYLRSNEYLELSAREQLGKVAPGEKVVILPDSSEVKDSVGQARASQTPTNVPDNFSQWMQFFFSDKSREME